MKKKILVTGSAGFIGYHLCKLLIKENKYTVYGIDDMNNYYDVKLKKDRLKDLKKNKNFIFKKLDICNYQNISNLFKKNNFFSVINLAAQAGVRHSIHNPEIYLNTNINGFFNIMDSCRVFKVKHLIFASTSSVYGDSKVFPLKESENTDKPVSFYAATKKSNEVLAYSYSSIYKIPITGLRFFTVYGTMGRPDMALAKFANAIKTSSKLELYNNGKHERDFTHVDDVVLSIANLINKPSKNKIPFDIFNIGSSNPKKLLEFLNIIEKKYNKKSTKKTYMPMQLGDVHKTHADIRKLIKKIKYKPRVSLDQGIEEYVHWFKNYYFDRE